MASMSRTAAAPAPQTTRSAGRAVLRTTLRAPISRRAWSDVLYALAGLPLAVLGFVLAVVPVAFGVALAVTFIGLPLLAASGLAARRFAGVHRRLARALLHDTIPGPRPFEPGRGMLGWLQSALRDGPSWRARAYLVLKLPLAVLTFYATVMTWVEGVAFVTYPIWWHGSRAGFVQPNIFLDAAALIFRGGSHRGPRVPHRNTLHIGDLVYLDSWPRILLVFLAGILFLLAAPWVVHGLLWVDRRLMRGLLGRSGSDRVRQLEVARAQVVDDAATTLRRIERDLHDGTQAQLATLAMTLGQAKEKLERRTNVPYDPEGALDLVDAAHRHAKEALVELRDIARGIHPPALDVGLDAALTTLVARSAVPALLQAEIPVRPAMAIETIAYFTVAELLANVTKHSRARHATVEVTGQDGMLRLAVTDDGIGGARPGGGSGLLGLTERVRAVDGQLQVSSPPGGPTVITVELPLHA
jgi:signal transduction histidine kinase